LRDVSREVVREHGQRLPETLLRRARHVVSEVARTFDARDALLRGDVERFGAQISATHVSLRELFEVSIPELDLLVEAAQEWPGVLGARLTGAGFGGCVAIVLRRESQQGFREHVERAFHDAFRRRPAIEFFSTSGGPREVEG
jgi:galactokinase